MNNAIGMQVIHSQDHLSEDIRRMPFRHILSIDYRIKQLPSLANLHNKAETLLILICLIHLDNIRMVKTHQNPNFVLRIFNRVLQLAF
jgi:hypothetical protein